MSSKKGSSLINVQSVPYCVLNAKIKLFGTMLTEPASIMIEISNSECGIAIWIENGSVRMLEKVAVDIPFETESYGRWKAIEEFEK